MEGSGGPGLDLLAERGDLLVLGGQAGEGLGPERLQRVEFGVFFAEAVA